MAKGLKIKFEKKEPTRAGKLFLNVEFTGGDADTEHPIEIEFKFGYANYKEHLPEIEGMIEKYMTLKEILDINSTKYCNDYKKIEKEYGEEIATLFDNTPNDPQNDFQDKCYLSSCWCTLVGYDEKANKFEAFID